MVRSEVWYMWSFFWCFLSDIAFNVAAGPAAVATGAHVNGSPLTQQALRLGALAAATKSGLLAFVGFVGFAKLNTAAYLLLIIVSSVFGIALLVTAQVSNLVLGEVPTPLLIAALVAALPLQAEGVGMYISSEAYLEQQSQDSSIVCSSFQAYLGMMGFDALGGYVFARMAHNKGMDICAYGAAAAAGGVYGVLSGIPRILALITWYIVYNGSY